jgi:hypothetical protein
MMFPKVYMLAPGSLIPTVITAAFKPTPTDYSIMQDGSFFNSPSQAISEDRSLFPN